LGGRKRTHISGEAGVVQGERVVKSSSFELSMELDNRLL
jgi:hypothetical protein